MLAEVWIAISGAVGGGLIFAAVNKALNDHGAFYRKGALVPEDSDYRA